MRDLWEEVERRGETDQWVKGVGEGGVDEWVQMMDRLLRWGEKRRSSLSQSVPPPSRSTKGDIQMEDAVVPERLFEATPGWTRSSPRVLATLFFAGCIVWSSRK